LYGGVLDKYQEKSISMYPEVEIVESKLLPFDFWIQEIEKDNYRKIRLKIE